MSAPGQPTGRFDFGQPGVQPGKVPSQSGPLDPTTNPKPTVPQKNKRGGGVPWVVFLATVVMLVLAILVIVFVVENRQMTSVWFFGSREYMSVARALSLSALGGFVVGLLVGLLLSVRARRKLKAAKRRLQGSVVPGTRHDSA